MINLICGPMFAGKSSHLIKNASSLENPLILKLDFDDRYSRDHVVSHDKKMIKAININKWDAGFESYKNIFFDEIQFFQEPYFNNDILSVLKKIKNNNVFLYGINYDTHKKLFPVIEKIMPIVDNFILLNGCCQYDNCVEKSTITFKKENNEKLFDLGQSEKYMSLCDYHYHKLTKERDNKNSLNCF